MEVTLLLGPNSSQGQLGKGKGFLCISQTALIAAREGTGSETQRLLLALSNMPV